MNIKKFFALAKEKGVETAEVSFSKSSAFSFEIFQGAISSYEISTNSNYRAKGIYKGKLGICRSENASEEYFVDSIIKNASFIEKDEEAIIFEGSPKYSHKNLYSKALAEVSNDVKLQKMFELEKYTLGLDPRIKNVEVSYSDQEGSKTFTNTYGLNLKEKSNYYVIYLSVYVQDGDELKAAYDCFFSNDPTEFKMEEFAKKVVADAISKLHGENIKPGTYKAVLNRDSVSSLLNALVGHVCADSVQKHVSKFEGKVGEQVISNKLTVYEKPVNKTVFASMFDAQGVATYNKTIFNKGVLTGYLYDLERAKKDNTESTGNSAVNGVGFDCLVVKPGKLSEEELFAKVGNGLYITSLDGLHAGLNATSGDFSLQAEGYEIKDGKIRGALGLFTVSGNLFTVFNDILAVGNNSKLLLSSNTVPSIAIKHLKYSV